MADEPGKVVFMTPEDSTALQELPEGETIELTAVFRKEAGNRVCLVEADGAEVSSYEEEDEEYEEGEEMETGEGDDMITAMEKM